MVDIAVMAWDMEDYMEAMEVMEDTILTLPTTLLDILESAMDMGIMEATIQLQDIMDMEDMVDMVDMTGDLPSHICT